MPENTENQGLDELLSDFSRFYILTILYEGPAHGYQIMSQFKKRVKKEISPSLVYPFLEQLEDKGYVKHTLQPVGDKVKKVFHPNRGRPRTLHLPLQTLRRTRLHRHRTQPLGLCPLRMQSLRGRLQRSHRRQRDGVLLQPLRSVIQRKQVPLNPQLTPLAALLFLFLGGPVSIGIVFGFRVCLRSKNLRNTCWKNKKAALRRLWGPHSKR